MKTPIRVLIVEDSPLDADLMVAELAQHDYEVVSKRVETAEELRKAFEDGTWDVVLSAYGLPSFNKSCPIESLRKTGNEVPFIIVSGTAGEESAVASLKAGAHDYVTKGQLARLGPSVARALRDVSQSRERLRLEEQLRQAQKLEGIGRLAGGIAHDFNNILTTIAGYSEMVLEQLGENTPISADLREIRVASDRAASLTKQLLAFGRRQVLHMAPVDLNQVVCDTDRMLRRLIGEDIEISLSLTSDGCSIIADRTQLEQVLVNVAANARDAMPFGGRFSVETALADAKEVHRLTRVTAPSGQYVRLRMTDTGTGMDAHTRERIFEPFFTTKEMGRGTGLGLATVYGIVKQLGGSISVSSEIERGTTFTLYFPKAQAKVEPVVTSD